MEVIDLKLKGLKLIKPQVYHDDRGFFMESFSQNVYETFDIKETFVQDNHSYSKEGCIRGMHFQAAPGQAKLVRVVAGTIFDVVVDLRKDSPTFGQWEPVILDGEKHLQLYIPVGFAHGFCITSPSAHVLYKVSTPYNPSTEVGFRWNDPEINIQWPVNHPIISERDQKSPLFADVKRILR